MSETDITKLAELFKDEKKLAQIGSRLVKAAIERTYRSRLGIPPDPLPVQEGRADTPPPQTCVQWADFIFWKEQWSNQGGCPPLRSTSTIDWPALLELQAESQFSEEEVEILKKLDLLKA